jgi:hypothetical protein
MFTFLDSKLEDRRLPFPRNVKNVANYFSLSCDRPLSRRCIYDALGEKKKKVGESTKWKRERDGRYKT